MPIALSLQRRASEFTLHADRGTSVRSKSVALLLLDLGVTKTHSRPHVSDDNPFSESQFRTMKYRPEFLDRFGCIQDTRAFCSGIFCWYDGASPLRLGPARAGNGALRPIRKRRAATPGRARCCLSTSPGALRTKLSQTTGSSHRRLDQQAGSNSRTAASGRREAIRCRQRSTSGKGNALGGGQNRGCCGSTELAIVVPRRSWREISLWKTGDRHKRRRAKERKADLVSEEWGALIQHMKTH